MPVLMRIGLAALTALSLSACSRSTNPPGTDPTVPAAGTGTAAQAGSAPLSVDRAAADPLAGAGTPSSASADAVTGSLSAPTSGPGELRIAFTSDTGGNSDIYTMRPDGSDVRRLTVHEAVDYGARQRGDDLLFGSLRAGRAILYRLDPAVPETPERDPEEFYRNTGGEEVPDWSPDGELMTFSAERDYNFDIHVCRPDGSPQRRVTSHPAHDTSPRWSPDGRQIVFTSNRHGQWDVFVIGSDGSGERNLTNSPEDEARPTWSPDGRRILFSRTLAGGKPDLFVLDLATGAATNLTQTPHAWEVISAWSPEGDRIAFGSDRDGNWEIYTMDTDGANVRRLTRNPKFDGDAIWIRVR